MTTPAPPPDPAATKLLLDAAGLALGYVTGPGWEQFSAWLASDGEPAPLADEQMRQMFRVCCERINSAGDSLGERAAWSRIVHHLQAEGGEPA